MIAQFAKARWQKTKKCITVPLVAQVSIKMGIGTKASLNQNKIKLKLIAMYTVILGGQTLVGTYNSLALQVRESGLIGSPILKLEYLD